MGGPRAVADLLALAGERDKQAVSALKDAGRWLGFGLAVLVNVFNPSRVALGGLYSRIYPYVKDQLMEELRARAMPATRSMVEVTSVHLGDNAPLFGAAELALAPWLRDPTMCPAP